MRRGSTSGTARRVLGVAALGAALVTAVVDPGPAQAATIPTPPAVCNPAFPVPGHPVVTSFSLTPTAINVTNLAKSVTFTIKAKDAQHPIASVFVEISARHGASNPVFAEHVKRVSGTAQNGTWQGILRIPRWSPKGTWTIDQVSVAESEAFQGFVSYGPGGTKQWPSAWSDSVTVTSTPDVSKPTVTSVKLSTRGVNTANAPKQIHVTVKAKDNLSGISRGVFVSGFATVGGRHYSNRSGGTLLLVSGSPTNGTYSGSITIPRFVGSGKHTWSLDLVAFDAAGNYRSLGPSQLAARHLTSTFAVTSTTDATKPVLKGLSFTGATVNATQVSKNVAVTLKASDTFSTVASAEVTLTSPSGLQEFGDLARPPLSSGTWTGNVTIPRCSEPGVWRMSAVLTDFAGNVAHYTPNQVKALGFSSSLTVEALDEQPPTATVPASVAHAGPVVVTFSEPTLWKGSTTPLAVTDSGNPVAGAWTCKNTAGTSVGCNANNADVKKASFQPTASLTVGHTYDLTSSAGIYDTSGNGPAYLALSFTAT